VTFYEALTGRLPFPPSDTGSEYEVLRGHIELPPPPLASLKPDIPAALSALVMRSLEKDPDRRFQSAAEFLGALIDYEQNSATTREEASRPVTRQPQLTHSMTEMISYDTRQAPITSTVPAPRPVHPVQPSQLVQQVQQVQHKPPTQVIESRPVEHRPHDPAPASSLAGQKPRSYGLLIIGAFIALVFVAGVGFLLLKQSSVLSSTATNTSKPTPEVTPTTAVPPEDSRLKLAREAEAEERYKDAIMIYGEYLVDHALDTSPRVKEIQNHKSKLSEFYGLVNLGQFEMNKQDYAAAERNYIDALKLLPESKLAQAGLEKAKSLQTNRR
jgi:serine/threonine protein kinase